MTQRGFVFIVALLALTGLSGLALAGFTRSLSDIGAAKRYTSQTQAFYLAEGGVDAAFKDPRLQGPFTQAQIQTLLTLYASQPFLSGTGAVAGQAYTVYLRDEGTAGDPVIRLVSTGTAGASWKTRQATVRLPLANRTAFDYSYAGAALDLSGSATLGAMPGAGDRVPLYIGGAAGGARAWVIETVTSSIVWASKVDFVNPLNETLDVLCRHCTNAAVFPVTPAPAPIFNTSGVAPLPPITIDPTPYYTEALRQQAIDGQSYHHITSDTTFVGGSNEWSPVVWEGVIYVEAGVSLKLTNNVVIHGTIFHEGSTGTTDARGRYTALTGNLDVCAGASVAIQSAAEVDIDRNGIREAPFAPGAAILGLPVMNWSNNAVLSQQYGGSGPGVDGFVMASRNHDGSLSSGGPESLLSAAGTIQGGVIAVDPGWMSSDDREPFNCPGPCRLANTRNMTLGGLALGGSANIQFQPLSTSPPGLPSTSGSSQDTAPTLLIRSD